MPPKEASPYQKTIRTPNTDFEMRANLPKKEPVLLQQWEEMAPL